MKTFLMATLFASAIFTTAHAQTAATKTMSEQQKNAANAKKEANLLEAFNKAGLTDAEQLNCKALINASAEKIADIKADALLSEDDKKTAIAAIYVERNDQLQSIMGDAKYKVFKATQIEQRQSAGGSSSK